MGNLKSYGMLKTSLNIEELYWNGFEFIDCFLYLSFFSGKQVL